MARDDSAADADAVDLEELDRAQLYHPHGAGQAAFRALLQRVRALSEFDRYSPAGQLLEGYALYRTDEDTEARQRLKSAYEQAETSGVRARAALRLAEWAQWNEGADEALEWLERARECVGAGDSYVQAHLDLRGGLVRLKAERDLERAAELFARAARGFQAHGDQGREIWAVERVLDALIEGERTTELASYDLPEPSEWPEKYEPASWCDKTLMRCATCLAAFGHVQEALEFARDSVAPLTGRPLGEVLRSITGRALFFQQSHLMPLLECALDAGLATPFDEAYTHLQLGKMALEFGEGERAIELFRDIVEETRIDDEELEVMARCNAASYLISRGELDEAESWLPDEEVADRMEYGETKWAVYHNLASLWMSKGSLAEAVYFVDRAIDAASHMAVGQQAGALVFGAQVHARVGNREQAAAYLERGSELAPHLAEAQLDDHWQSVGLAYVGLREFDRAHECLERAADLAEEQGDEQRLAYSLANLLLTCHAMERSEDFDHYAARFEELAARYPFTEAASWQIRGYEMMRRGRTREAKQFFERAIQSFRKTGSVEREALLRDEMVRLTDDTKEAEQQASEAFELILGLVASVEGEASRLALLNRLRHVGGRLAFVYLAQQRFEEALQTVYEIQGGQFLRLTRELAERRGEVPQLALAGQQVTGDLQPVSIRDSKGIDPELRDRAVERYRGLSNLESGFQSVDVTAEQLSESMNPGELALEYFIFEGSGILSIFVISEEGVLVVPNDWSPECVERVKRTRAICSNQSDLSPAEAQRQLMADLQELNDLLIEPVRELVEQADRLYLSPGARLAMAPFQAFVSEDGKFLADHVEIRFLMTTAQLAVDERREPAYGSAAVFRGDDSYTGGELKSADAEVEEVRGALQQAGMRSEESFWGADLVHYAGHAEFDDEEGMAGALHLPEGHLQAVDFLERSFDGAPLVVLSGCETGEYVAMGDAFVGFVRSVLAAGASNVLSTSWEADDESARHLMRHFYEALLEDDLEVSAALARAQQALRESRTQWRHPYFWANFRCWGIG